MKKAKKLASLLLALVMALALAVPAMATQEGTLTGGSITINDAVDGQKYTIYQILYLESYNKDSGAYSYKANTAWKNFLEGTDILNKYVKIDAQGYVTWVYTEGAEGNQVPADAAAFAKLAQAYAAGLTGNDGEVTASGTTVSFSNLNLGYYLVDSTLGTLCSLDTTNPTATIQEKNEAPTNAKTVEEDSTGAYGATNDADIGQVVNFKSTITLPKGSENVVFQDTMSQGLTLDTAEGKIKVYTDANMTTELASSNYVVDNNPGSGLTFTVTFTKAYLDSLTATATVYVKYSATVNAQATIGGDGNANTSNLKYGDENNTKTTPGSTTTTYTWGFNVFKYTMKDSAKSPLAGAKFVLYKTEGDKTMYAKLTDNKITGWTETEGDATTLTSGNDGTIVINGLDSGIYHLKETASPTGYNLLSGPVEVKITDAGEVNPDGDGNGLANNTVEVENKAGAVLPSTGGMGTTIFYAVGSILVLAAMVLLVTKKRMAK